MKAIKTTIALILMIFVFSNVKSQARIGFTFEQIKNEFSYPKYTGQEFGKNEWDCGYHFYVVTNFGYNTYFFDEDSICNLVYFIPLNDSMKSFVISYYDKTMDRIKDDEWIYRDDINKIAISANYFTKEKDGGFEYFEFKKTKYE